MFSHTTCLYIIISTSTIKSDYCWIGNLSSEGCPLSEKDFPGNKIQCAVIWYKRDETCENMNERYYTFNELLETGKEWIELETNKQIFRGKFYKHDAPNNDGPDEYAYIYVHNYLLAKALDDITPALEESGELEECEIVHFKKLAAECSPKSEPWSTTNTTSGIFSTSSDTTTASSQTFSSDDGSNGEDASSNITSVPKFTASSSVSPTTEAKSKQATTETSDRRFTVNGSEEVANSENFKKKMASGKQVKPDSMNVAEFAVLCIMGIIFWLVLLFMHWEYYWTRPQVQSTSDTEHSEAKSNSKAHLMKDRRPTYVYKPKTSTSRESHRYQNSRASSRPSSAESIIQVSKLRRIPGISKMEKSHELINKKVKDRNAKSQKNLSRKSSQMASS